MNLPELLLAGLIIQAAAFGSLQLLGLAAGSGAGDRRLQAHWQQLEAELLADEQLLRRQPRPEPPSPDCSAEASRLQALLAARPLAAGLQRQAERLAAGEQLLITLTAEPAAGPTLGSRARLIDPAALGMCLPASSEAGR